jgi:hypothetical protein
MYPIQKFTLVPTPASTPASTPEDKKSSIYINTHDIVMFCATKNEGTRIYLRYGTVSYVDVEENHVFVDGVCRNCFAPR